jgi:uncharacterized membrane protein (DUF4010 family)
MRATDALAYTAVQPRPLAAVRRRPTIEPTSLALEFPYRDVVTKIAVSVGVGLLVGLEREWANKEVGVRTFSITALTGTLAWMLGPPFAIAAMVGVLLLVVLLNSQTMLKDRSLELTTSAALMVMVLLGALVGADHYFTAASAAIGVTMLLAWKEELAKFADALTPDEIRGAVLLGLLSFVIYPLLPDRYVDPYDLFNPRQIWVTAVVIAGIGFANYVLLRLYSTRGLYYAALLGGLVNSTAAVAELSNSIRDQDEGTWAGGVAVLLLTNVAMFLRNVVILGIFAKMPLAAMAVLAGVFTWFSRDRSGTPVGPMKLSSPVSLKRVLKFAAVFAMLAATGTLAQRQFHDAGFLVVAIAGGLISSASTTATAASLVAAHAINSKLGVTPQVGGIATVLTSIASAAVNIPLVYQQTRRPLLTRRLAFTTGAIAAAGLAVLMVDVWVQHG